MSEVEWLRSSEIEAMLLCAGNAVTDRKLSLFVAACCRRIWHILTDARCRQAVEIIERYADKQAKLRELKAVEPEVTAAREEARAGLPGTGPALSATFAVGCAIKRPGKNLAANISNIAFDTATLCGWAVSQAGGPVKDAEHASQAAVIRDLFVNPFHPVSFASAWRTDTAVSLAQQMYESRDFGAMPILADALQDAGCDSEAILSHCRDATQVHVRGCWVTDLVLGKS